MAKNTKKTKQYLLLHSRAKVELLGAYMKRYLPIIQQSGHAECIRIMDLFCSEGVYKNGGKGSPIVILDSIKELYDTHNGKIKKWTPFQILFNDYDKEKVENLKGHIKKLHLDKIPRIDYQYREKDYQEIVKLLPGYMKKKPKSEFFIFIDPYTYKEITAADIKSLLQAGNGEVLLFQPSDFMYRFLSKGTPKVLTKFIADVLPDEKSEYETPFDFIDAVKVGFRKYMGADTFVDSFTIQRDVKTVFSLFFFSKHIRGFEKMLEAKWELDSKQGKGWSYDKNFDIFNQGKEKNDLEEFLKEFLKIPRSNVDLYEQVLHLGYLPKHAVEVMKEWQNLGLLKALDNAGNPLRKGAFYVTYESKKQQNERAFFNLKN